MAFKTFFRIGQFCLLLAGFMPVACASVPTIDPTAATTKTDIHIVTPRGPLSLEESAAVLAQAGAHGRKLDDLERHLAIERAVSAAPITAGNRTRLLFDGDQTFHAMFAAMKAAHHSINLEFYILEDVAVDGLSLSDLLVKKRREGVAVNVIYDSYGSDNTPDAFFDKLRDAGVIMVSYNPLDPLDDPSETFFGHTPNMRDHRKILVADGTLGITGGINLSKTYLSGPGKSQAAKEKKENSDMPSKWHDTDVEIKGPAVAELQKLFMLHWTGQNGPPIEDSALYPHIGETGKDVVHILGSTPDKTVPEYYATVISAIRNAQTRIWLYAGYFVPTDQERDELVAAAARGVDVRLMLPQKSDASVAVACQRATYGDFLKAGIKIYEMKDVVLHSKTITIDGVWSVVGSSNFDHRSVVLNDEVDAVVLGREFAAKIEDQFRKDSTDADAITLEAWQNRGLIERFREMYSGLIADEL